MGWPILFLKDRWKRYNEKNEVNGPIIYLTAQVKFLDDLSLIPHFISQPMPNASPVQADTSFTKYPDETPASPLHVHTPHPEHHLCQHVTTRAFCAHEQPLQQGHHLPLQTSIVSTASSSSCLWSHGFPSHNGKTRRPSCARPGHLLDLISYHSLFCSPCSNRVSLPAGPGTSQSFPLSGCFALLSPPYSSFWGKVSAICV